VEGGRLLERAERKKTQGPLTLVAAAIKIGVTVSPAEGGAPRRRKPEARAQHPGFCVFIRSVSVVWLDVVPVGEVRRVHDER